MPCRITEPERPHRWACPFLLASREGRPFLEPGDCNRATPSCDFGNPGRVKTRLDPDARHVRSAQSRGVEKRPPLPRSQRWTYTTSCDRCRCDGHGGVRVTRDACRRCSFQGDCRSLDGRRSFQALWNCALRRARAFRLSRVLTQAKFPKSDPRSRTLAVPKGRK
jgi:hypothetical protein